MGRKAWEATKEILKLVEAMCIAGITHNQIAEVVGVDYKTLKKNCGDILQNAKHRANAKVAGALYNNAIGGNVTAQIFWLKTRAGWKEQDDTANAEKKPDQIVIQVMQKPEQPRL